jgi:putative flippase GtrA
LKLQKPEWVTAELLRKIVSFGIVGITTAICYALLIQLFRTTFDFGLLWSGTLAYPLAMVINYIGQAALTFRVRLRDKQQFARFIAANLIYYATSMAIMSVLPLKYGVNEAVAILVVVIALPIVNFALYLFWVFKAKRQALTELRG